jgi:hypothetical protein
MAFQFRPPTGPELIDHGTRVFPDLYEQFVSEAAARVMPDVWAAHTFAEPPFYSESREEVEAEAQRRADEYGIAWMTHHPAAGLCWVEESEASLAARRRARREDVES